jgi:hypothetical protein
MAKSPKAREDRQAHTRDDEDERRFHETVRNLLNTPPKPHRLPEPVPLNKHAKRTATKQRLTKKAGETRDR